MPTNPLEVRATERRDVDAVRALLVERWGSSLIARSGRLDDAADLPGLVATAGGALVGLLTYRRDGDTTELVTIDATPQARGTGTRLLEALVDREHRNGQRRIWLVTTNDNLDALRFYQRRGLRLVRVNRGAVDDARMRKPSIPVVGHHGIALHDELVLELDLSSTAAAR